MNNGFGDEYFEIIVVVGSCVKYFVEKLNETMGKKIRIKNNTGQVRVAEKVVTNINFS